MTNKIYQERLRKSNRLMKAAGPDVLLHTNSLFKVSLNILRFHHILRPNRWIHTSLLFSPINLILRY